MSLNACGYVQTAAVENKHCGCGSVHYITIGDRRLRTVAEATGLWDAESILTTNLAAVVCVDVCQCAKCDQFLPARSHFESKRPENFVRITKFPYAAFGPLFAFHCPLFFTRNNDLEWKSSRFAPVVRRSVADKQLA